MDCAFDNETKGLKEAAAAVKATPQFEPCAARGFNSMFYDEYERQVLKEAYPFATPNVEIKPWVDPLTEAVAAQAEILGRDVGKKWDKLMSEVCGKHGVDYDEVVSLNREMEKLRAQTEPRRDQLPSDRQAQDPGAPKGSQEHVDQADRGCDCFRGGALGHSALCDAGIAGKRRDYKPGQIIRLFPDDRDSEGVEVGVPAKSPARIRRQRHVVQRTVISKTGIGWGFLACGFVAPAIALLTASYETGVGVSLASAAFWSLCLALSEWQPTDGGE